MLPSPALVAYAETLKTQLEAKDVRAAGVVPATVLLSFPGDGQITIDATGTAARVLVGDAREREDPSLLVRTPLSTWLSLCAGEVSLAEASADVLGDVSLFSAVARLCQQKRSGVSARLFC